MKGTPAEVSAAITNTITMIWGEGKLAVATVEAKPYAKYESTTGVPGEFNGKKLEWLATPTHWIILKAESTKEAKEEGASGSMKVEFAVAEMEKEWWLLGVRYDE